ncbi:hypothetical protein GE21DRAFT_4895 [Neurospora crassa]|uniref:Uncharacterized protein n=1 Tax=Neurospora crassa (strain ATCC 24698 / 74-OR23-1A / CBS 708.71 / DSM 1257 / FGSC 987) TaxID=367110 RepID=Q7S0R6_NEUCR|nr:hypothetical protein NCU09017 [Neurospora crassa OR74A]EAA28915.2 hypothetical protein NCU09017 [Neurospora crassa OR74A]KHE81974.1 hypothetical protein GE21DRAFT_4895 [Neurospora crassa]|eukprot:XP_958151.2 hypothetical protein NCU09017 [Neurospora crassa OR74A]
MAALLPPTRLVMHSSVESERPASPSPAVAPPAAPAIMDSTAKLVSDLHQKLADLEGKVAEFHRYLDDCLKNYPELSSEVSRVIAESMHKYPALTLMARDARDPERPRPQSPTDKILDSEALSGDARKSPPPILYHTSGTPKEGPRSPHEREREFQGLFTPRYLPLLDSTHRGLQSPPESPVPTPLPLPLSQDNVKKVDDLKEPEAMLKFDIRPTPVRRLTDRSTSSVESSISGSDSKVRRSALRRSSSSTKGSPRRVRFEFAGEEVFPSTSPQDASAVTVPPPLSGDDGADGAQTTPPPPPPPPPQLEAAAPIIPSTSEPPAYTGISLLDVEGEEDALPRPKKVSSTQALRALSRNAPLDAGIWTEVNADPEEAPKMNSGKQDDCTLKQDQPSGQVSEGKPQDGQHLEQLHPQAQSFTKHKVETKSSPLAHHVVTQQSNGDQSLGSPLEELQRDEDDDSSDDDEFLSMKAKKKPVSPTIRSSFGRLPTISETAQNTARSSANNAAHTKSPGVDEFGKGKVVDDVPEDAFFDFEGEGISTGVESDTEKYIAEDDFDDDDNDAAASKVPPEERPRVASIASGSNASTEPAPVRKIPPATPSAALFGHSVGSYKGTSMRMNPISNPKLYDEIAGMRNVHTFVGSVDGRSGVEAIDMGSYRAYLVKNHASATPRSFTERLAFEEAMERRRSMRDSDDEDS